jgi:hypothetical protein
VVLNYTNYDKGLQMKKIFTSILLMSCMANAQGFSEFEYSVSSKADANKVYQMETTNIQEAFIKYGCTGVKIGNDSFIVEQKTSGNISDPTKHGFTVESKNCHIVRVPGKCETTLGSHWLESDSKKWILCSPAIHLGCGVYDFTSETECKDVCLTNFKASCRKQGFVNWACTPKNVSWICSYQDPNDPPITPVKSESTN